MEGVLKLMPVAVRYKS